MSKTMTSGDERARAHRPVKVLRPLHRYRIKRVIGRGYTGVVYEARWLLPNRQSVPVACKLGCDDFRDLPVYRDHIRRVAALARRLTCNHGNLVTVLGHFEEATRGWPCLVMELIDGCSVADLHDSHRRLPFSVIRRIVMDILAALAYLPTASRRCFSTYRHATPSCPRRAR